MQVSGLSVLISSSLEDALKNTTAFTIMSIFTAIITFLTEISSNTATATVFIPICLALATSIGINPLYLGVFCIHFISYPLNLYSIALDNRALVRLHVASGDTAQCDRLRDGRYHD